MGSFKGHVLPGSLFLMVGLWHIWSSVVRYVVNPKGFRVRVWNPVTGFGGRLYYLELYLIAVGAFIDMCIELLYSTHLKFFVNGVLNPHHMNDFEHGGMLLMFFVFSVVALLSEKTRIRQIPTARFASISHFARWMALMNCATFGFKTPSSPRPSISQVRDGAQSRPGAGDPGNSSPESSFLPLPEGALCFIAATAFSAEYLLFYFHSTTHKGLEGYYHLLLVLLIGFGILSIVSGALIPTSFPADLCSGIAMTLQGLWFYQTAFTLYGPMMPDGCMLKDSMVMCHSNENEVRGELLANFQMFGLVFMVLVGVVGSYNFADKKYGQSDFRNLRSSEDGSGLEI